MKVQFLISSVDHGVHRNNRAALEKTGNYLVINQIHGPRNPDLANEPHTLDFQERGAARSRNRAIEHADAEIGFLCDEDVDFVDDPGDVVRAAYQRQPEADIIIFRTATPEGHTRSAVRRFPPVLTRTRTLLSIHMIMISFRVESIRRSGIRFDERFGLGARYPSGPENIFMFDCDRAGLKIGFDPAVVTIHPEESSGYNLTNERTVIAKGAIFARLFPRTYPLFNLLSCVKFRPLYRARYSFCAFHRLITEGSRELLRQAR